ncbi:MAG TPA: hypothetical protein PLD54_01335 [Candidatus Levybacteria bacterium]|nr:hypothetical protein [Candidatus Levybacteria bacterium]
MSNERPRRVIHRLLGSEFPIFKSSMQKGNNIICSDKNFITDSNSLREIGQAAFALIPNEQQHTFELSAGIWVRESTSYWAKNLVLFVAHQDNGLRVSQATQINDSLLTFDNWKVIDDYSMESQKFEGETHNVWDSLPNRLSNFSAQFDLIKPQK